MLTRLVGAAVALAVFLFPLAGGGLHASPAAPSTWTRLRTPTFVLIGDQGERPLRRVAERLEQFREVFRRVFPSTKQTMPAPIVVHVFGSGRSYQPFMPLFNGKRVDVGGYFQQGSAAYYITLSTEAGELAYPTIYHEYVHLLVRTALADVPVWFNEGLAEYYSTYQMFGEKEATLGRVHEDHVYALRERFIPLSELLAVDHRSSLYNEGDRRNIFYAESWALVHYLLIGNPQRKGQLATYLEKYASGTPSSTAVREAFGVTEAALEEELKRYVRQSIYQSTRVRFTDKVAIAKNWTVDQPSDADAQAALADLLLAIRRPQDAGARAQAALQQAPEHARALAVLGRLKAADGKPDEAIALFDRAVAAAGDTDYLPWFYAAQFLVRGEVGQPANITAAGLTKARSALERVAKLEPTFAEGHGLLAYALLATGDPKAAMSAAATAFTIVPRHEYALFHARARVQLLDQGARPVLAALATRGSEEWIRKEALDLLNRLTQLERAAPSMSAGGGAPPAATGPSGMSSSTGSAPRRPIPVFRAMQGSEVREVGSFTGIECPRGAIVFTFKAADRVARLSAKAFDQVELLTYREEPPGQIGCGPRATPERVYFTWLAAGGAPGTQGMLTALELLPDDYTP